MSKCIHKPSLKVEGGTFENDGRPGVGLFISAQCRECGEPYVFAGLRSREMPQMECGEEPSASPDYTLARLPIYCRPDAPDQLEPPTMVALHSIAQVDIPLDQVPEEFKRALGLGVDRSQLQ